MAGTEVKITISANDTASSILKKVGASATAMAKDLTAAGKAGEKALDGIDDDAAKAGTALAKVGQDATKAGTAIQKAGQQTQSAGRNYADLKKNATEIGVALGGVVGVMAKAGQAAVNQTNSIRALRAAYGDSADELIKFADGIQQTTIYSNDAARASVLFAQSLAQNYNISTDQIEELVARTADLAAVNGIDLFDAITRTSGAIRGEGEAAERLGLNMSDSAVAAAAAAAGLTGWNTTMSESEKAAFRFTVFLEQSNYAMGQAAAQADTTAGKTRQFVNELQDLGTKAGAATGPLGEVLAVTSDFALAMPLIGAGLAKAGTGFAALIRMAGLAAIALGPIGLVAAAGAAVAGLVYYITRADDSATASEAAAEAVDSLTRAFLEMKAAGAIAGDVAFGQTLVTDLQEAVAATERYRKAVTDLQKDRSRSPLERGTAITLAIKDWQDYALTVEQAGVIEQNLQEILAYTGPNVDKVRAAVSNLFQEYDQGRVKSSGLASGTKYISDNMEIWGVVLDTTSKKIDAYTQHENLRAVASVRSSRLASNAQQREMAAMQKSYTEYENTRAEQSLRTSKAIARANQEELQTYTDYETTRATLGQRDAANHERRRQQLLEEADLNRRLAAEQDNLASGLHDYEGDLEQVTAFTEAQTQAQQELANSYAESVGIVTTLDGTYQGLSVALGIVANDFLDVAVAMQGITDNTSALNIADAVNDAAQALDGVLATFQAIDALGQRSESAGSIAKNLIGEPGELALIDELLANGAIQIGTYNAAVEAGTSIAASNAAAQESLNAVRAAQLPTLASANAAYAEEIQRISELAPAQQALAIGYLDVATQARASELASLALSASMGQLGDNGEAVATKIIGAATAADPILKELLLDMGLIEKGAEGDIKVNFPDADTATQAIRNLEDAIDDLNVTLGGLPSRKELEVTTKVTGPLADGIGKGAKGAGIFDIPDQSANITVNTSVTGALAADITGMAGVGKGAKGGGLFSIEDQSATVTVDTRQTGASIPAIKTDVDAIDGTTATATVDVNDQASIPIDSIAMRAHAYGGSIHTAGLKADSTAAEETIAATTASGVGYASNIFVSTLDGNPEPFYGNVGAAQGVGDSFAATTFTATADGDPSPFYGSIGAAEGVGNSFAGSVYTASVDGDTSPFYNAVGGINGSVVGTAYINVVERRIGGNVAFIAHGGAIWADMPARSPDRTVPGAAHGRAGAGRTVMVGEYGRELVTLPTGSFVTPHPATESRVREERRGRGDGGIRIQTLNLYPATPDVRGAIEARTRTAYRTG